LRTLNLTKNFLTSLPPLNMNLDLNKVQELYLSGNAFSNSVMRVVSGYSRLKVLHLAQNELTEIYDEYVTTSLISLRYDTIEEINVSTCPVFCLRMWKDLQRLIFPSRENVQLKEILSLQTKHF